jgi:NAD+ synthase
MQDDGKNQGDIQGLPPELAFDPEAAAAGAAAFLRTRLDEPRLERYVLGLSGGVDSACSAALAARAVGPERLITVKMPMNTSHAASRGDAELVEESLGIPVEQRLLLDVTPIVEGWRAAVGDRDASGLRAGNAAARSRMLTLWDLATKYRGIVLGTENRTENLLGYFTIYGDSGTAVEPITAFYKSQIWVLAAHLGLPEAVIQKAPTADLWPGQTDEDELGVRYRDADRILYWFVDRGLSADEVRERTDLAAEVVARVVERYRATEFKRAIPYRYDPTAPSR